MQLQWVIDIYLVQEDIVEIVTIYKSNQILNHPKYKQTYKRLFKKMNKYIYLRTAVQKKTESRK